MISGSKNPKRLIAFRLRKLGKSYREIVQEIRMSKGTISLWFKDVDWSKDIQAQLAKRARDISTARLIVLNTARKKKLQQLYRKAEEEAAQEFAKFRNDPLFIAGIFTYWGEGDKRDKNSLRLCNTDPIMIKIYVEFLQKICNVPPERICPWLLLYPDLNEHICKKFWIKNAGLASCSFKKSIFIEGRHKRNRLTYGVCNISVHDSYLKAKLLRWIKLFSENPPIYKQAVIV